MAQNYNLKKHFKGHKRHTKSEYLLYSVSNTVFLCFCVFYNIQPDKSLWFESSRHYWITPICCCSLPPGVWSYQTLLSLLSEFWRTEKLWHKITSKLDLERAYSCHFLSRKKFLVSLSLLSLQWFRNFSSTEVSTAFFLPVLRDECSDVSEFVFLPPT